MNYISHLFSFPLLFIHFIQNVSLLPMLPSTAHLNSRSSHRFDSLINSVVRRIGESDTIIPSVCPFSCKQLYEATDSFSKLEVQEKHCSCTCPLSRPVYLSTTGTCVEKINDCDESLRWESEPSFIPVVRLCPHCTVLPKSSLVLEGTENSTRFCNIKNIIYENLHTKWKAISKGAELFQLRNSGEKIVLYFGGNDIDIAVLAGAVIVIKLECENFIMTEFRKFCISLRVSGTSGSSYFRENRNMEINKSSWRIETTFIFVMALVIVITLATTFFVWHVCWKLEKRKLITKFQKQFAQQYKINQNQIRPLTNVACSFEDEKIEEKNYIISHALPRRPLIFNAEFLEFGNFEHHSLQSKSFLTDLRKIVDLAREKIKLRRYSPTLSAIIEEVLENTLTSNTTASGDRVFLQYSTQYEPKSVDHGRELMKYSDEENVIKKERLCQQQNVAEIFKSRPSFVPVLLTSSLRKQNIPKTTVPPLEAIVSTAQDSRIIKLEALTSKQSKLRVPGNLVHERKKYEVFLANETFSKSLPRRINHVSTSSK